MPTLQFKGKNIIWNHRLAIPYHTLDEVEKLIEAHPKKRIIVYAPACFLEEDYMKEKNIDYVGIPYNLFRRV